MSLCPVVSHELIAGSAVFLNLAVAFPRQISHRGPALGLHSAPYQGETAMPRPKIFFWYYTALKLGLF